ncbi:hypothetical protein LTR84_006381 [Exophiala bonariae]|uniref:Metallo-beta-lactamase domain-containing protein n=1 Tax=Exophiala bonariae TaxID=1690606 RepID=A0AAV9N140_9EURO|nr:hypothetical protein LTR84_006381 [Exophiala bonariae]
MTTHCHYDHIMGISKFPPTARTDTTGASGASGAAPCGPNSNSLTQSPRSTPPTTVLTSALGKPFVTPYSNLQKHSLADTLGLSAPKYDVGIWAEDYSQVVYHHDHHETSTTPNPTRIATPYTILHTPGHTPDSLSWYDAEHRVICVGDSFYLKHVDAAHKAPWGDEPPMPTMFNLESDLADWWRSLHKVLDFVVRKNRELADGVVETRKSASPSEGSVVGDDGAGQTSHSRQPSSFSIWPFSTNRSASLQTGFEPRKATESHLTFRSSTTPSATSDPWLLVDLNPNQSHTETAPRVRLAGAHSTSRADALDAILEIRAFVAAILRDDGTIPKRRVEDGNRGEEMWLWDHALVADKAGPDTALLKSGRRFSVLSPLVVVQEGRRRIPRAEWFDV